MIKEDKLNVKKLMQQPFFHEKPERIKLLLSIHKEYALLIHKMLEARDLSHLGVIKDDMERVLMSQRIKEQTEVVEEYLKTGGKKETNALAMARVYASSLELFWKVMKKMIHLGGLNPKDKHLNIPTLKQKIIILESKYDIKLPKIIEVIDSTLRNSVGHENIYFSPPNIVVFLDKKGTKQKEVARLTTDDIYQKLVEMASIMLAIVMVENTAIVSVLEPLLKLSDEELAEYGRTGVLTSEMEKKI